MLSFRCHFNFSLTTVSPPIPPFSVFLCPPLWPLLFWLKVLSHIIFHLWLSGRCRGHFNSLCLLTQCLAILGTCDCSCNRGWGLLRGGVVVLFRLLSTVAVGVPFPLYHLGIAQFHSWRQIGLFLLLTRQRSLTCMKDL